MARDRNNRCVDTALLKKLHYLIETNHRIGIVETEVEFTAELSSKCSADPRAESCVYPRLEHTDC